MKNIGLLGFVFLFQLAFGQIVDENDMDFESEISKTEIDTLDWNQYAIISLSDTKAYSLNLKSDAEKKYYLWLEKRVDDVYPFVQKAVYEYYHVKDSARTIENKKDKKEYIKSQSNALADEYEAKLKKIEESKS